MLRNPESSKVVIARKFQYIFNGYNELDFPFPEMEETFNDIKVAAKQQLEEINRKLENLTQSYQLQTDANKKHHEQFIEALNSLKNRFSIIQRIEALENGIMVEHNKDNENRFVTMEYPYGKCIELCADYVELSDLLYRTLERFGKFGPNMPYFNDAMLLTDSKKEGFQAYLDMLEKQDFITAFNQLISTSDPSSEQYHKLITAKENGYQFSERTELLKEIYKMMRIPFAFQSNRYKHHLKEDLMGLDIVLFPTMKAININDFSTFRPFNFFPLGITKKSIFADEFNLSSADFFYHDVKHSLDMVSRNWIAYLEHGYSMSEATKYFSEVKKLLDEEIVKHVDSLNLTANLRNYLMRAINLTLFEVYHEEGYPYDPQAMISALKNPNPFYGQSLDGFLKEKLGDTHFFAPAKKKLKDLDFPVHLIDQAKDILLHCLCKLNSSNKNDTYPEGCWEITRGSTQINPYQQLKGEHDYEKSHKRIGNIFLLFKEKPKSNTEPKPEKYDVTINKKVK